MAIDALSTAMTANAGTPRVSAGAAAKLGDTYDSFLKLLTTQLKHQDPLAPMDSNQFISQLVDFAGVEQQIASNTNLEKLIGLQTSGLATNALGYIGKTIEATGDANSLVDGKAQFAYTLPSNAAVATVSIVDALGRVIAMTKGESAQGRHDFTWDGKDFNGNAVPSGEYRIRVGAVDANGGPITATTTVIGRVNSIETDANGVVLRLGATKVPFGQVTAVKESTI